MRRLRWIPALFLELLAWSYLLFLRFTRAPPPTLSLKGRPILLIHGYLNTSSVWRYHRRKLEEAGLGPVYALNLGYPFRSIEDYAALAKTKAEQIARETNHPSLTLIGHSMGGLVSSLYATQAPQGAVSDVVTIGSPLSGTHLAKIALGANGRQMERHSPFLATLRQAINARPDIRFYHIATQTDQIILPPSSALPGLNPQREYLLDGIGHVALLFSSKVSQRICSWLRY